MELNEGTGVQPLAPVNYADDNVAKPLENKPTNFYSLTLEDLKAFLKGKGKEQFRAQQIFKWVYEQRITDVEQMTNLSKDFRAELPKLLSFELPKVVSHLKSVDGTQKFLFDVGDNMTVESVLIPSEGRQTLCISSEVGCNIGCKFCFTGKQKLKRRLRTEDIVGQFMHVHDLLEEGQRITNIVFMGMGEPLDNPEAVFKTIDVVHSPWGINLSRKKITVSTSGIVPEMWRIADAKVRLAVSLNAPTDEIRTQVMPINKKWNTEKLLAACKDYTDKTGDKVTFEYVLLKGVTDSIENARQVAKLTRNIPCKINIIPFNEHPGTDYQRPADETIEAFHSELNRLGVHVLLRRSMGRDIFAACGQLNSTHKENDAKMDISNSKLAGMPKSKRELLAAQALENAALNATFTAMSYEGDEEA
ncbi:23S rRNA (adenine(2503)-C(2))-methyltransferase RlmN [Bdellovibrio sp. NC01]|uniref:23S rRNA (adenine(2503)-C(2))-methyltransferase RlmN n=1 Tax=Bdellovibrio sp. NC01 TaxID=2220073 RepID=UPI001156D79A|nr:23S rRNA (adenine(2503)-C(2))-methyltransferase RlmN [Bdellovibrio sp. NC01]QDK36747.1 23S rRNA (adenine(2503)-C(2))-methyltransferase RlmN [Bdellovibrio sp. NC01]